MPFGCLAMRPRAGADRVGRKQRPIFDWFTPAVNRRLCGHRRVLALSHVVRNPSSPRLGLALGSGGARGLAHLGVIRVLREAGIHPDCVAGTSIGALVGAAVAAGRETEIEAVARELDVKGFVFQFLDFTLPRGGLVDGDKITGFLRGKIGDVRIEDLAIPFAAVATEIRSGMEVVFRNGPVLEAVRASISIPGMFTPVEREQQVLVDGGLVNPLPIQVVRSLGADIVLAVDLNHGRIRTGTRPALPVEKVEPEKPKTYPEWLDRLRSRVDGWQKTLKRPFRAWADSAPSLGLFDVLGNSIRIMEKQITEVRLAHEPPDVLVRPHVGQVSFMEFQAARECIEEGEDAMRRLLPELRQKLGR